MTRISITKSNWKEAQATLIGLTKNKLQSNISIHLRKANSFESLFKFVFEYNNWFDLLNISIDQLNHELITPIQQSQFIVYALETYCDQQDPGVLLALDLHKRRISGEIITSDIWDDALESDCIKLLSAAGSAIWGGGECIRPFISDVICVDHNIVEQRSADLVAKYIEIIY